MNAALWGIASALGWGSADFIARFSGRKFGPDIALLGMLLVGGALLTAAVLLIGLPPAGNPIAWSLVVISGTAIVIGTLLLYDGLARGPVTVVAPIVGAYPVLNVAVTVARGARPGALQWAAMLVVLVGVVLVALSAGRFEKVTALSHARVVRSVRVAVAAAVAIALGIGTAQEAIPIFGELQTIWLGRIASVLGLVILLGVRRRRARLPVTGWPLLALQGLLDSGAYVALMLGGHGAGSEITVVIGSSFSIVTVALARIILKEPMSAIQWVGAIAIVAGIAALTAMGSGSD